MSQPICVLCAYYHPHADPHAPDRQQSCPVGRHRLEHELLGLRAAYLRLIETPTSEQASKGDALSLLLPAAPVPSPSKQPSVSGSKERQLIINADVLDLTAGAQGGVTSDPYGDQVGHLSVATVLNEWVGYWHERFYASETRPRADAVVMLGWIATVRLEYIADHDDAIADFAEEIRNVRSSLRRALGEVKPKPVPMWGITCPHCQLVSQLMLDPDDPLEYRECANCGLLLSPTEYRQHLRDLVETYRTTSAQAAG